MHGNEQERFKKVVTKERQGNTYHTDPDDIDGAPHRHTSQGDVVITSENWDPRKTVDGSSLHGEAQTTGDQAPTRVKGGIHPFQGTPESHVNLQRERVPRQEVQDAEIKSLKDKKFANEKDQRDVSETLKKDIRNPRSQR